MNLCLFLFLTCFAIVQAGYYASNSFCYHSCPCPDSITLETSSVCSWSNDCICSNDCKFNQAPLFNQVQVINHRKPGIELWLAQLCSFTAFIVFQLASMES